jgi:dCMP deaminase
MSIARTVASRSNCVRRKVGALIVVEKAIIGTGYNGAPLGVRNCDEGGCPRCASNAAPGEGYDSCICVHAEQNAIVLAARHGNATNAGILYTTLRPCFGCAKERSRPASARSCSTSPTSTRAGSSPSTAG